MKPNDIDGSIPVGDEQESSISLRTLNIDGDEQEIFEVYADEDKSTTLGFVYDENKAPFLQHSKELIDTLRKEHENSVNGNSAGFCYHDTKSCTICKLLTKFDKDS